MQSNNESSNQEKPTLTFIERARQNQIIDATIKVLAEYGYVNTSFTRIATQADISPSLISYHFKDKRTLSSRVLEEISSERVRYIQDKIAGLPSAADKLRVALEADLAHMGANPERFQAVVEILFGMRGPKGSIEYLGDQDDLALVVIRDILEEGQRSGEFGSFDASSLAIIIDGGRDTFLAQLAFRPSFNLTLFTKTLVTFALEAVRVK